MEYGPFFGRDFWSCEQRVCLEDVGEEGASNREKQLSGCPAAGQGT